MKQTWRWFGPGDPVTLKDIRQAGVEGIVTSLHHVPNGNVWTRSEIRKRIELLSKYDYDWDVVESLPVHKSIKTGNSDRDMYIRNYIRSLENLSDEGVNHVVYNFMALTDWTRTDLDFYEPDGAKTIRYDAVDIACFDIFILKRKDAEKDYDPDTVKEAEKRNAELDRISRKRLIKIILMGLPGTVDDIPLEEFRKKLEIYHRLGKEGLRRNFSWFMEKVLPVAKKLNIILSIHADDPPFSIFGLPRIVSTREDLEYITGAFNSDSNALCFCTGTFGANKSNNVLKMLENFSGRISFVHLRNVKKEPDGSFYESKIFEGSLDMTAIVKLLVIEQKNRGFDCPIPFRPDHGQSVMKDFEQQTYPGYPAIGRLKALAELRGLIKAFEHTL
ncbi:MAG: mannonate dehydratase [Bacteroidales bacterium]|nr:mannonate dehydratase [Bacteroidales bacterium]